MAFEELTDTIMPPVEAASSSRQDLNTREVMDVDPVEPPSPLSGHPPLEDCFEHLSNDDNGSGIRAPPTKHYTSPLQSHQVNEDELEHLLSPADQKELTDFFNTVNYGDVKKLDKGKGRAGPSVEQEHTGASSSGDRGKDLASPISDKTDERKDSQISNAGQRIEARHDFEARYDIEVKVTEVDDLSASPPESNQGVEGAVTVSGPSDTINPYANDPLELRFRRQTCKLGDLVIVIIANLNHLNDLGEIRQTSGPDPASDCFNTVLNTPQRRKANHYLKEADKHIGTAAMVFANISSLIATMETHHEGLDIDEHISEHIAETTEAYESAGRSYYWALRKLAVLIQRVYPDTSVRVVEKRAEEVKEILGAQSIPLYRDVPVEDQFGIGWE